MYIELFLTIEDDYNLSRRNILTLDLLSFESLHTTVLLALIGRNVTSENLTYIYNVSVSEK